MELAEINYKKTVQQAFQEVYDILNKRDAILKIWNIKNIHKKILKRFTE